MNRTPLAITALLSSALLLSGCGALSDDSSGAGSGGGDGVTVAAAFYPLAFVTGRVLGDHGTVDLLTTPGTEPHDLEPTIRETAAIVDADLVVIERDFQPGIDAAVDQNATGEVIDAAEVVGLIPFDDHGAGHEGQVDHSDDDHGDEGDHGGEGDHAEEGHEDHDHGDLDPHFWLDPIRLATLGDEIADRLAEIDPDNAQDFRDNSAALRDDLTALDESFTTGLADCERTTIVVSHDAFGYLDKYGIEVAAVAGLSPDATPTVAGLAELEDLIAEDGITTVFSERLASPRLTASLARDAGVQTAVLDPVEGLTDETADEDYLSLMEQNLAALQQANGCR
ncbi:metal ABC transporter substrate-binding protein [Nocardioides sp. R-C-SC26]|uniref:metal ABC transporter substrate-binding protein n=1 Tax=Nocardioides sp. R-C-SC26 TaxID=2870414 RepID=UPI001E5EF77A|nr:metal ABC transporter substrate-binding protein [Nocardioides sp. R-C-SC26]